ncbi:MAG: ATP-binding cassette domain-containing protein [Acidimicrobiales bacterium]
MYDSSPTSRSDGASRRTGCEHCRPTPAVALRGLHKSFNDTPALTNLEVVAPNGKITVLLGPNGAGKTTAIRCITGPCRLTAAVSAPSASIQSRRRRCSNSSVK